MKLKIPDQLQIFVAARKFLRNLYSSKYNTLKQLINLTWLKSTNMDSKEVEVQQQLVQYYSEFLMLSMSTLVSDSSYSGLYLNWETTTMILKQENSVEVTREKNKQINKVPNFFENFLKTLRSPQGAPCGPILKRDSFSWPGVKGDHLDTRFVSVREKWKSSRYDCHYDFEINIQKNSSHWQVFYTWAIYWRCCIVF